MGARVFHFSSLQRNSQGDLAYIATIYSKTFATKSEYSDVILGEAIIFKIYIENGQINATKITKYLNGHKTSTEWHNELSLCPREAE